MLALYLVEGKYMLRNPSPGREFDVHRFAEHCTADCPSRAIRSMVKIRGEKPATRPVSEEKWTAKKVEVPGYEIILKKK